MIIRRAAVSLRGTRGVSKGFPLARAQSVVALIFNPSQLAINNLTSPDIAARVNVCLVRKLLS